MELQQERGGTAKAILLVLLLYVLSLFVAGLLSFYGIGSGKSGIAFQAVLLAAGMLLFLTRERRNGGQGSGVSVNDAVLAGILVIALAVSDVLSLAARAASDSDLRFAQLPPFPQLAAEQLLAAFGEELLFTGFLFSTLRIRKSFALSVAIVAAIFVILHWPSSLSSVTARAAYIVAACAVFERTQSILLTIAMHLAVNGFGFISVLLIGDAVPTVLILGGMGAEAGLVLSVLSVLLALYSVLARSPRSGSSASASISAISDAPSRS